MKKPFYQVVWQLNGGTEEHKGFFEYEDEAHESLTLDVAPAEFDIFVYECNFGYNAVRKQIGHYPPGVR